MITHVRRRAAAQESAARLGAALLLARCRAGAVQPLQPLSPQGCWLSAASQGLLQWLHEGGFAALDTVPGTASAAVD